MKTKQSQLDAMNSYRDRMREQGFVLKQVWILPDNSERLKRYSEKLRAKVFKK